MLAALGSLVVRCIENFLYPVLVKDRLKVPAESIFVSLVGGMLLFGWTGLVLGPVILTTTSALLEICAKRFGCSKLPCGALMALSLSALKPLILRGLGK